MSDLSRNLHTSQIWTMSGELRISAKIIVRCLDGRMAFVPKGPGVWTFSCASSKRPTGEQKTAQGFSPGNDTHKEIALKGRPNGIDYNVYI